MELFIKKITYYQITYIFIKIVKYKLWDKTESVWIRIQLVRVYGGHTKTGAIFYYIELLYIVSLRYRIQNTVKMRLG